MHLSHPNPTPLPCPSLWKNCVPQNWSLVPKRLGTAGLDEVIEAKALPPQISAQKAELTALMCALQLGKDKKLNIFTNSKYGFHVLHAHAAIWKERGMLTAKNSPIKHNDLILALLEAVQLPTQVAVILCKGHQKDGSFVS